MTAMDEHRRLMEQVTQKLMAKLGDDLEMLKHNGVGITLLAFQFEAPGAIAYISTAQRDGMIKALKEFLAFQEAGITTEARGERARG